MELFSLGRVKITFARKKWTCVDTIYVRPLFNFSRTWHFVTFSSANSRRSSEHSRYWIWMEILSLGRVKITFARSKWNVDTLLFVWPEICRTWHFVTCWFLQCKWQEEKHSRKWTWFSIGWVKTTIARLKWTWMESRTVLIWRAGLHFSFRMSRQILPSLSMFGW